MNDALRQLDETFFPPVEVDKTKSPGVVFFQDRETRFTAAFDAETGVCVGMSGAGENVTGAAVERVRRAVKRWQDYTFGEHIGAAVVAFRKRRRENES